MTLIEAAKLAIDAAENDDMERVVKLLSQAITEAEQQEPVAAIRSLTAQCAALIQERDDLQKQVWRYEKNGVTCQTYRHKVDRSCIECNAEENYASPPEREWQALAKELDGVIADVEEGDGFDDVCLDTVKYVRDQLAASPKREWQGLTDDEVSELIDNEIGFNSCCGWEGEYTRAVEARLKDKNT